MGDICFFFPSLHPTVSPPTTCLEPTPSLFGPISHKICSTYGQYTAYGRITVKCGRYKTTAVHSLVMKIKVILALAFLLGMVPAGWTQRGSASNPELVAQRNALEKELESVAIIERKVMVPMRDGKRMAADIYRPRDESRKYPTIFSRTPYNFNYWDVRNGVYADMSTPLTAVKNGYAYVVMNERGHFFSEGNYDILGPPLTDGADAITWLTTRPWSNGKLGTIGCSSTAEWQLGVAALGTPGDTTMIPQGFGAGVGRVAPYLEQGNWYRGGAVQMLFIAWLYGEQNQVRPMLPPGDWAKALAHLPEMDIIKAVDGPHGIFADAEPVDTGGAMIQRAPDDPAWYKGGLWHDNMKINLPGFWFMSWYDVSVGPNLAAYNFVRKTARPEIANQQYAVIAPTLHCAYKRATEDTVVGERHMGDPRLDYDELTYGWFDHFLKGDDNHVLEKMPKVRYFTMGMNKWQTSDTWPPAGAQPMTLYLGSGGKANSLNGDGSMFSTPPASDQPDSFTYDPMNPVASYGGGVCCTGNAVQPGAFDQRKMEARNDILVYTSEPFKEGTEVSGPIDATIYVSSDAKNTDFTIKVIDVYPDGTAYNLDETIQRARYREGYDKPPVWMEPGKVYKLSFQPLVTSNYFPAGHRVRIEITSSNFPRFDRNLNTGGNNYDEVKAVVAHNSIHHSGQYASAVTLSVVKR